MENVAKNRNFVKQQILTNPRQQPKHLQHPGGGMMVEITQTQPEPQNRISDFGYNLLGEIVSDSEPSDLPMPRYIVYSKLKAVEKARNKLAVSLESDILKSEEGLTEEDAKLLKSLECAEICMRAAYESLENVWSLYTTTIDSFMYMRAMREAYQSDIERLCAGILNATPISNENTKKENNSFPGVRDA